MEPSGSAQPVRALALLSSPVGTRLSHPETDVMLNVEEIPLRGSFLRHAAALSLALGQSRWGEKKPPQNGREGRWVRLPGQDTGVPLHFPAPNPAPFQGWVYPPG